jgi:hypothetical protein
VTMNGPAARSVSPTIDASRNRGYNLCELLAARAILQTGALGEVTRYEGGRFVRRQAIGSSPLASLILRERNG